MEEYEEYENTENGYSEEEEPIVSAFEELFQAGEKDEAIALLFDNPDKRVITDLSENDITRLAVAITVGNALKCETLLEWVEHYMNLRISKNRQGRREVVAMRTAEAVGEPLIDSPQRRGFFDKIKEAMG